MCLFIGLFSKYLKKKKNKFNIDQIKTIFPNEPDVA